MKETIRPTTRQAYLLSMASANAFAGVISFLLLVLRSAMLSNCIFSELILRIRARARGLA